jgi:hypothetical protein
VIANRQRFDWIWAFVAACGLVAALGVVFLDPITEALGPLEDRSYYVDVSGFGVGLALFTALPAAVAAGAYALGWIGRFATTIGAALAPLGLALGIWAYVSDLRSDDPSSTSGIVFVELPTYALFACLLVIAVGAAARKLRASRRGGGAASGPTTPAGGP